MDDTTKEPALSERTFWSRAAAFSFGLWALALPLAANWMAGAVTKAIESNDKFRVEFSEYVRVAERRLIILEERQAAVLKLLSTLDDRVDRLDTWRATATASPSPPSPPVGQKPR